MIDKKVHYVFNRYDQYGKEPDVFVSPHHNEADALFGFIFQTLGYQIIKVTTDKEVDIKADSI